MRRDADALRAGRRPALLPGPAVRAAADAALALWRHSSKHRRPRAPLVDRCRRRPTRRAAHCAGEQPLSRAWRNPFPQSVSEVCRRRAQRRRCGAWQSRRSTRSRRRFRWRGGARMSCCCAARSRTAPVSFGPARSRLRRPILCQELFGDSGRRRVIVSSARAAVDRWEATRGSSPSTRPTSCCRGRSRRDASAVRRIA